MDRYESNLEDAIRHSFLAGVRRELIDVLLRRARIHEIPAGHVFIRQADAYRCGILIEGLARVYRHHANGSQVTHRRIGLGAAVGVKGRIGRLNDHNVAAITDCLFLPLDAALLIRLARDDAVLAWAIAEEVTQRLDDTQIQIDGAIAGSVLQKVAGALIDLSADGEPLGLHISQERLAERIGASREATGRAIRHLRAMDLVRVGRSSIELIDPIRLEEAARGVSSPRMVTPDPSLSRSGAQVVG